MSVPANSSRRFLILSLIILILIITALTAFLVIQRLRADSSSSSSSLSLTATSPTVNPVMTTTPSPSINLLSAAVPPSETWTNLLVTVSYTSSPNFIVTLDDLFRTPDTNFDQVSPLDTNQYSVLRVKDSSGAVLSEQKFTLATQALMEGDGLDPYLFSFTDGTQSVIVTLPDYSQPTSIELQKSDGTVIAQRSFAYSSLSLDPAYTNVSNLTTSPSASASFDQPLTIAITHSSNDASFVTAVAAATMEMLQTIAPWPDYIDNINLMTVPLTQTDIIFDCEHVTTSSGQYPVCRNQPSQILQLMRSQTGIVPDFVIVTTSGQNRGSVQLTNAGYSNIITVGSQSTASMIAHEFLRSLGQFSDDSQVASAYTATEKIVIDTALADLTGKSDCVSCHSSPTPTPTPTVTPVSSSQSSSSPGYWGWSR